jgi:hypothetical protein
MGNACVTSSVSGQNSQFEFDFINCKSVKLPELSAKCAPVMKAVPSIQVKVVQVKWVSKFHIRCRQYGVIKTWSWQEASDQTVADELCQRVFAHVNKWSNKYGFDTPRKLGLYCSAQDRIVKTLSSFNDHGRPTLADGKKTLGELDILGGHDLVLDFEGPTHKTCRCQYGCICHR